MTMPALAPATTALIVIDLQEMVVSMATEPRPASAVVANGLRLVEAFRAKGSFIVLVRVDFAPDGADMLRPECDAPTAIPASRPASWSKYVPGLAGEGDHLLTKKQWGAFYGTDLELQLRRRRVSTIVLCGISTCFGVESTARQAYELGYHQVFVEDAMAARTAAEHEHTVTRVFPRIGRVQSTEDVLVGIGAG